MRLRAQTSLEYILTYGWAIFIIIISIGLISILILIMYYAALFGLHLLNSTSPFWKVIGIIVFGYIAYTLILAILDYVLMKKVEKSWSNVKKSWSDIEIIFQKRHNMITKLIDSVSGYIKDENGVIAEITQLQSIWELIPQDDIQFKMNISNKITASLKSLFAVAEKYPDLKADKNFLQLQQSITELETELAKKGEEYNNNVNILNKKIHSFPSKIVARRDAEKCKYYEEQPLFQVSRRGKE